LQLLPKLGRQHKARWHRQTHATHLDKARAFASQKRKLVAGDRMKSTRQTVWLT
jgi:hypothetical protein